jgi:hypothetical protein
MTSVWLAEKSGNPPDIIGIFSTPERARETCQETAAEFFGPHSRALTWQETKGYSSAAYHHPESGMFLFQVTRFTVDEASKL